MRPHVPFQVAGQRIGLSARLTDMHPNPLPSVPPHVRSQETGPGKSPAARLADVRLLRRMCPHVQS